eukprot:3209460-Prymnesium_polylepis.1
MHHRPSHRLLKVGLHIRPLSRDVDDDLVYPNVHPADRLELTACVRHQAPIVAAPRLLVRYHHKHLAGRQLITHRLSGEWNRGQSSVCPQLVIRSGGAEAIEPCDRIRKLHDERCRSTARAQWRR